MHNSIVKEMLRHNILYVNLTVQRKTMHEELINDYAAELHKSEWSYSLFIKSCELRML